MAYRVYVTDCLKGLVDADKRYWDIIKPHRPEETRSAQDIASDIITRHGLILVGE